MKGNLSIAYAILTTWFHYAACLFFIIQDSKQVNLNINFCCWDRKGKMANNTLSLKKNLP